jgi:putative membrane protein
MKKSEFDFSVPNRQSYVAILLILFKTINVVVRQLLPVLFVFLLGGSGKKGDYILWSVIAIAFLSMIYSTINFFRTYFYIKNDELILHSGIFQRKKTSIPFSRIQTINFEQNIIHQLFNVLKLKIDTAGSDKNEFEFHAIEASKAHALRALILQEKKANNIDTNEINIDKTNISSNHTFKQIMSLSPTELLKVGLTENHIKSGGLILLFFFWIYQNLQEVGVDVDDYSTEIPEWEMGIYSILFVTTILMVISVIISLVRTVISNFDLQFLRSAHGFKVVSGLFTKKEVSALDHKIQYIAWSDNLLKRLIGFKDLSLYQASSTELKTKQNIKIPGCQSFHINNVVSTLFGKTDFEQFTLTGVDRRYFTRFALIIGIIIIIAVTGIIYYSEPINAIPVTLIGIYIIISRYIAYKKKALGYNEHLIYIRGGTFGDKAEILPMYKIQALELHQTPYQTRNQLCSLTLYTASGNITIPYIGNQLGNKLADLLIYKVESDHRKWM